MTTEAAEQASNQVVEQRQAEVREIAQRIWDGASVAANSHAFLTLWGIRIPGLRVDPDGSLIIVPMRDTAGTIHNLAYIAANGERHYLPGGRIVGLYFGLVGRKDVIIVAHGFIGGVKAHAILGDSVAIAFAGHNIAHVASALQKKYPSAQVIVATDIQATIKARQIIEDAEAATTAVHGGLTPPLELDSDPAHAAPARAQLPEPSQGPPAADQCLTDAPGPGLLTDFPDAKKLLAWIKRKGLAEVTRKQILQLGPSSVRNAEAATGALLPLLEQGWLTSTDGSRYQVTAAALTLLEGSVGTQTNHR